MPSSKRVYTNDEVQAILSRAIDRQRDATPDGLSHEDLLAVGRDAGISADAIEAAIAEAARDGANATEVAKVRRDRQGDFRAHLFTYVVVIAFLVVVNMMTTSYPWAIWPALGWGVGLLLHMRAALFPSGIGARAPKPRSEQSGGSARKHVLVGRKRSGPCTRGHARWVTPSNAAWPRSSRRPQSGSTRRSSARTVTCTRRDARTSRHTRR